jgi:hypothetical protein
MYLVLTRTCWQASISPGASRFLPPLFFPFVHPVSSPSSSFCQPAYETAPSSRHLILLPIHRKEHRCPSTIHGSLTMLGSEYGLNMGLSCAFMSVTRLGCESDLTLLLLLIGTTRQHLPLSECSWSVRLRVTTRVHYFQCPSGASSMLVRYSHMSSFFGRRTLSCVHSAPTTKIYAAGRANRLTKDVAQHDAS